MNIERTFDPAFLNSVIHDPSVREGAEVVAGADLSAIAADLKNFLLVNEHGGFVVIHKMQGVYECHTQFLPAGRGKKAIDAAGQAFRYMFCKTPCERVVTKVRFDNERVKRFTDLFFKQIGRTGDYLYYCCDFDDWVLRDDDCQKAGQEFHDMVEQHTNHDDDDDVHDRFVGAAALLIRAGNYSKAQYFYNRWAVMSGYEPIVKLSDQPLLARAGDMLLSFDEEVKICL